MEQPKENPVESLKKSVAQRFVEVYDTTELNDPDYEPLKKNLALEILDLYSKEFPEELPLHQDALTAVGSAVDVVLRLRDAVLKREYGPQIEAVVILGGGGTFGERLKSYDPEWLRWADRDRIKAGFAIAREIARSRANAQTELSRAELQAHGPTVIYPGNPAENAALREAIANNDINYPAEKIKIIETVSYQDGAIAIRHTGDQAKVIFDELADTKNIAVVQHIPDFIRTPFYLEHQRQTRDEKNHAFWAFGLSSRRGSSQGLREDTLGHHALWEFERLIRYIKRGHLATRPIHFENLTND